MTETDTSRNKLHRLIGQLSHDYACDLEREASDVIVALLARAEKAEAERDTAWNDAIEAAARAQEAAFLKGVFVEKHPGCIRALRTETSHD